MTLKLLTASLLAATFVSVGFAQQPSDTLRLPGEDKHLSNLREMTHGGENAEAYFSPDGKYFSWQGHWDHNYPADQIFIEPTDGSAPPKLVSTGKGKTTCSFFIPGTDRIVWCSTHGFSPEPPVPEKASSSMP